MRPVEFIDLVSVAFSEEGLRFEGYPFAPASVYPRGFVAWREVQEVAIRAAPPEVWLRDAPEILFVSAEQRDELARFAEQAGVPLVRRVDLWDLILEPFLDTTFSEEMQERSLEILAAHGVTREQCANLRGRVERAMVRYNFDSGLWDWVHLGLYDVLSALRGEVRSEEYRAFYGEAMEIARRATMLA
jgi:hypothetical protein